MKTVIIIFSLLCTFQASAGQSCKRLFIPFSEQTENYIKSLVYLKFDIEANKFENEEQGKLALEQFLRGFQESSKNIPNFLLEFNRIFVLEKEKSKLQRAQQHKEEEKKAQSVKKAADHVRKYFAPFNPKLKFDIPLGEDTISGQVSPDASMLLLRERYGVFKIIDLSSQTDITDSVANGKEIRDVFFSADGKLMFTFFQDDTLAVMATANKRLLYKVPNIKKNNMLVTIFDVSLDGKLLAITTEDNVVRILNSKTGHDVVAFPYSNKISKVKFSPDGEHIFVALNDRTEVIHLNSKEVILSIKAMPGVFQPGAVKSKGSLFLGIVTNEGVIRIVYWNEVNGQNHTLFTPKDSIYDEASPDGKIQLTSTNKGDLNISEAENKNSQFKVSKQQDRFMHFAKFSADSRYLAVTAKDDNSVYLQIYDLYNPTID